MEKGSQLLSRDGHPGWGWPGVCPGVLASCVPSLGSVLPLGMWAWHGQPQFLTFRPFLESSHSISQLLCDVEAKVREKEREKENNTVFCDPPLASASKKTHP